MKRVLAKKIPVRVGFDFDGVIVDSNQLKYDAFFQIFDTSEKIEKIIRDVLSKYRESSRYDIIRLILIKYQQKGYLDIEDIEKNISLYAEKYNSLVEEGIVKCKEIEGVKESIKELSKSYSLYINSTTPLEPLKRIIKYKGLLHYFKDIYGGPNTKIENLKEILSKERILGKEALVIGDGISDLESARRFNCLFIGVRNKFNTLNNCGVKILDNLEDLKDLIEKHNSTLL